MLRFDQTMEAMKVVEKLKKIDSMTNPEDVLEYIRRVIVSDENISYDIILERCRNYQIIKDGSLDSMYSIFEKELPKVALLEKDKNEQILLLTEMIMML